MNLSNDTYSISNGQTKIAGDLGTWMSQALARLQHLGTWWTARTKRNHEMRELARFSDRELWDIGLSRSDILSIENGTYRRD
jgi:uncharacterized protein YjiS (DUF1127 family)